MNIPKRTNTAILKRSEFTGQNFQQKIVRGASRTTLTIYDEAFCEKKSTVLTFVVQKLRRRYSAGF